MEVTVDAGFSELELVSVVENVVFAVVSVDVSNAVLVLVELSLVELVSVFESGHVDVSIDDVEGSVGERVDINVSKLVLVSLFDVVSVTALVEDAEV